MLINQLVKLKKPTVEQQIDFVHQCREKKLVVQTADCTDMLRAIEENLIAVRNWNTLLTKTVSKTDKEVSNG